MHDFEAEVKAAFETEMACELADPDCPIEAESWAYREMVNKRLRLTLQELISRRFPLLASEVQNKLKQIKVPKVLQQLIVEIALVPTAEEARRLILEAIDKK